MIDAARAKGMRVMADQYFYDAASSNLGIRFPSWVLKGGQPDINRRLDDQKTWLRIKEEMRKLESASAGWRTTRSRASPTTPPTRR